MPMLIRALSLSLFLAQSSWAAPIGKAPEKIGWIETADQQVEGWTVTVDVSLLPGGAHAAEGEAALKMLANHLQRIAILLPAEPLAKMRRCGIHIEHQHPELRSMQYHPSAGWLANHGYDPSLAKKVHIPRAAHLLSREQMLKHPAVVLHELAHAYHDQILGFDDPEILRAYNDAKKKGIYEKVLLHTGREIRHYATTDHKEYFAEATEAYLYRNDFYPFVAAELRRHDPAAFTIMENVWGRL
ncbi:MAG: metallopeptidase [Verrucomicrobiae bacterium]|nr:metallopeptidase [Verrucomicrobiae bacterium]MCP5534244.1 metallopeptidase [Akkermansiaceae bacterium]MCP5545907.1 metallopeptidase [Akkermansiaceae bacterium]